MVSVLNFSETPRWGGGHVPLLCALWIRVGGSSSDRFRFSPKSNISAQIRAKSPTRNRRPPSPPPGGVERTAFGYFRSRPTDSDRRRDRVVDIRSEHTRAVTGRVSKFRRLFICLRHRQNRSRRTARGGTRARDLCGIFGGTVVAPHTYTADFRRFETDPIPIFEYPDIPNRILIRICSFRAIDSYFLFYETLKQRF